MYHYIVPLFEQQKIWGLGIQCIKVYKHCLNLHSQNFTFNKGFYENQSIQGNPLYKTVLNQNIRPNKHFT